MEMENISMTVVLGWTKAQKVLPFLFFQKKKEFRSVIGNWKRFNEAVGKICSCPVQYDIQNQNLEKVE